MPTYCITYDLRKPGRDYAALIERLKTLKAASPLESVWFVVSTSSAVEIRDYLWQVMDSNDGLLVLTTANGAAWIGLSDAGWTKWLQDNLGK